MAGKRSKGSAGKRSASRKSTSKKKIAKKGRSVRTRSKPVRGAKTRSAARPKARAAAVAKSAPARAAGLKATAGKAAPSRETSGKPARPAKSARGHEPGFVQSAFDFEIESQEPAIAIDTHLPPAPRKRGAPKVNSPDYPGESLTVGMPAPDFALPSTIGRPVSLSEFRGKRVILYFYPKDDTPGCTMEACAFRDAHVRVESKDAVVLGISLDDELSHQRFAQKYNLNFPLLSDKDAAVSRQYGTYKEKNLYGRSFWGIERTTFVIDREGRVEHVFRRVKVEGHAEEVMATLAG
jgi:peroxiredoxin Q/BCP